MIKKIEKLIRQYSFVCSKTGFQDQTSKNIDDQKNFFEKIPGYLRGLFCLYIITTLFLMIFIDKKINTGYVPNLSLIHI